MDTGRSYGSLQAGSPSPTQHATTASARRFTSPLSGATPGGVGSGGGVGWAARVAARLDATRVEREPASIRSRKSRSALSLWATGAGGPALMHSNRRGVLSQRLPAHAALPFTQRRGLQGTRRQGSSAAACRGREGTSTSGTAKSHPFSLWCSGVSPLSSFASLSALSSTSTSTCPAVRRHVQRRPSIRRPLVPLRRPRRNCRCNCWWSGWTRRTWYTGTRRATARSTSPHSPGTSACCLACSPTCVSPGRLGNHQKKLQHNS
jgi:hypothetical protein